MRDPARIYPICLKLAEHWNKVPDWRFGQLLSNFLCASLGEERDTFYMEDEEFVARLDEYFNTLLKENKM